MQKTKPSSSPHPAFRQAERAAASAKKDLYWAHHRLDRAQSHLDDFGPLSQLRPPRPQGKGFERIETFTNGVQEAVDKLARCERAIEDLRPELEDRRHWDEEHRWPTDRLRSVEAQLTELSRPAESQSRDTWGIRRALERITRPGSTDSPRCPRLPYPAATLEPAL